MRTCNDFLRRSKRSKMPGVNSLSYNDGSNVTDNTRTRRTVGGVTAGPPRGDLFYGTCSGQY